MILTNGKSKYNIMYRHKLINIGEILKGKCINDSQILLLWMLEWWQHYAWFLTHNAIVYLLVYLTLNKISHNEDWSQPQRYVTMSILEHLVLLSPVPSARIRAISTLNIFLMASWSVNKWAQLGTVLHMFLWHCIVISV